METRELQITRKKKINNTPKHFVRIHRLLKVLISGVGESCDFL